jgi:cold-inducible RNA-binding protein
LSGARLAQTARVLASQADSATAHAFLEKEPFVGNKLYVGNLAYSMSDESLQQRFGEFGTVVSAKVMMDRDSGRSKGFGFVEMSSSDEAQAAIRSLNGKMVEGRDMVVNEARPKESGGFGGGQRRDSGAGGGYRAERR